MLARTSPQPVLPPLACTESLLRDPHATLREYRREHGIVRLDDRLHLVLRAEDVISLLTDPRTEQVEGADFVRINAIPRGSVSRFINDFFLFSNGHAHRTSRGLFARSFTMGRIRQKQDLIRNVADVIVADLPRGEEFDFVERMAARVPSEMIARLLGLRLADAEYFSRRVYSLARAFTPVYPIEDHDLIERHTGELFDYVGHQLIRRIGMPEDDFLSSLVWDWNANKPIPIESLVHQVMGMIVGGVDTTRAAFAMMVALLLEHPRQWQDVKSDPSQIPGAVMEALRFEPSVGSIPRMTTQPIEVGGYEIPQGQYLGLSTMSAMRDPALYADPDCFDISRRDHPRLHAVFGHGPHRCIGEMLARFEMEQSLVALLAAVPDIELVRRPQMVGFGGIRQITPMTVRIG